MNPGTALAVLWVGWLVSWTAASAWTSQTVQRPAVGSHVIYRLLVLVGALLMMLPDGETTRLPLVPAPGRAEAWVLVAVAALGFAFTWWARIHIGRLWSSNVTRKADHHVVDTGPYAIVRHPIYSGLILAALATATARDLQAALGGAALMIAGFWVKARLEERFLREQLGPDAYGAYARRVPMLVPSLRRRTALVPALVVLALAIRPAAAAPAEPVLDSALDVAADLPRLHSLLVSWHGDLLVERYFHGVRATQPANMKSASKSVISALVGIAIDRGLIEGVNESIGAFFPEQLRQGDAAAKRAITIEDLLTMRSGLESTSNRNYGAWVLSRNWVSYALSRRLVAEPGTRMIYSTGNSHLLSAILTKAARESTWTFAQDTLGGPLGFQLAKWPQDPQGIYFGGNDMLMTPRQMLAFGELYLHGGRANGRQVVPASWVAASFVPRTESPRAGGRSYGYGWWIRDLAGHATYYAWGYGGQFIFIVPDLDLVVVATSVSTASDDRRGHNRAIYDLVEDDVIPAIAN
jgi:CubicO group peptidase (beta-lactamase class C family)/isoprenylcysteine carboxyl methyltransferase (ICMT) family protein YpbQ